MGIAGLLLGLMKMILPLSLMVGGLTAISWWWRWRACSRRWLFVFEYDAFDGMYEVGDPPDYEPDASSSIAARAVPYDSPSRYFGEFQRWLTVR